MVERFLLVLFLEHN